MGETVVWSESSELWQEFKTGSRAGRFFLANGESIVVVPLGAKPLKTGEPWVRPCDFWELVPDIPSNWQTVPKAEKKEVPLDETLTFLRTLFGPYDKGWIEMRRLPSAKTAFFPLVETLQDHSLFLKQMWEWGGEGQNVYVGVLPRGRHGKGDKSSIYQAGFAWAELDFNKQEGGEEGVMKLLPSLGVDMAVLSGGGVHIYWKLEAILDLTASNAKSFETFLKRKHAALRADSVCDVTRILRVPGTLNYKYDPPKKVSLLCL